MNRRAAISGLVALTLFMNVSVGVAAEQSTVQRVKSAALGVVPQTFKAINGACEALLTQKIPEFIAMHPVFAGNVRVPTLEAYDYALKGTKFVGWMTGVIPVAKTLANVDKFFYVIIESPGIGLITAPIGTIAGSLLQGKMPQFDGQFVGRVSELYKSYQLSNVPRNGVAIDENLSARSKVWLNWWYSFAIYSYFTAGSKLASASTPKEQVFAWSIVGFSGMWPLISQQLNIRVITPLLFSKFPKASLISEIKNRSRTTEELVEPRQKLVEDLRVQLDQAKSGGSKSAIKEAKSKLAVAESELKWVQWFRKDVPNGKDIPVSRSVHYWGKKTKTTLIVAVSMLALYNILRDVLVGDSLDDAGLIPGAYRMLVKENGEDRVVSDEEVAEVTAAVRQLTEEFRSNPQPMLKVYEETLESNQ